MTNTPSNHRSLSPATVAHWLSRTLRRTPCLAARRMRLGMSPPPHGPPSRRRRISQFLRCPFPKHSNAFRLAIVAQVDAARYPDCRGPRHCPSFPACLVSTRQDDPRHRHSLPQSPRLQSLLVEHSACRTR
uniref:RGS domain-containing protein n=1 Tax=Steinernema glaseri TaxID=37863 RepID=A0A1I8A5K2_9BILA